MPAVPLRLQGRAAAALQEPQGGLRPSRWLLRGAPDAGARRLFWTTWASEFQANPCSEKCLPGSPGVGMLRFACPHGSSTAPRTPALYPASPPPSALFHLPPRCRLHPPSCGQTPSHRPAPHAPHGSTVPHALGRTQPRVGAGRTRRFLPFSRPPPRMFALRPVSSCQDIPGSRAAACREPWDGPDRSCPAPSPVWGGAPPPAAPHIPRSQGDCPPRGRQLGLKINAALPQLMHGVAGPGLRAAAGRQRWPWGPGAWHLPSRHPDGHRWPQSPGPTSGTSPWLGAEPPCAWHSVAPCPCQVAVWRPPALSPTWIVAARLRVCRSDLFWNVLACREPLGRVLSQPRIPTRCPRGPASRCHPYLQGHLLPPGVPSAAASPPLCQRCCSGTARPPHGAECSSWLCSAAGERRQRRAPPREPRARVAGLGLAPLLAHGGWSSTAACTPALCPRPPALPSSRRIPNPSPSFPAPSAFCPSPTASCTRVPSVPTPIPIPIP